ncbi:MAG: hypothetical protein NT007_08105 [Candidatus Kapabacteria bacterium]|nr:hypothetical protein [Candidatus Kapabacteria bacterium]
MARKAACFIDTLIELDFIELNGLIVSDRILEYNTDWIYEKTVAIIDDTIFSGTTIFKLINKLENLSIKKIDVYAFCINEYWYVEDMLLKNDGTNYLNKPYLKLDHTSSLRFCKQIVNALSITPRPYNIDFPIYEKIKLTNSKIDKLFDSSYWIIENTTSRLQYENNIFCYSFNTTTKLIDKYNLKAGWKISDAAHVKLRLYSQKMIGPQNNITYLSKVVPFIIFNPISTENANKIINTICFTEEVSFEEVLFQLKTDSSRLIFIQFYYAEELFQTWLECAVEAIGNDLHFVKNHRSLNLLFSPKILDIISKFNKKEFSLIQNNKYLIFDDNIVLEKDTEEFNTTQNLFNLIDPFLDLYYKKELPARRIVKKIGKKAFNDGNYIDIINRLEDGISIKTLEEVISKVVEDSSDRDQILSFFLDVYVDNGVIVPITVNKNGVLYRGYRHGEEVIWGNYNNRLMGKYFEKYLSNINSKELPQTYFQKLLVLFLKIGLKESVLEEYSTLTPTNLKIKLLCIKAHIFGLISDYTEISPFETKTILPIIDPNTTSYLTTNFLQDHGFIALNKKNNFEFDFEMFEIPYTRDMEKDEPSDIDQSHIDKIYNIADLFGFLRKNDKINIEDLVLLTSCVNLHDNTSSLAAELQIYLNDIKSYGYKITSNLNSGFTIQKLKALRDLKQNQLWTAINSGYFKFKNYTEDKGLDLINDITLYFEENNKTFEARTWKSYWKIDIELAKNEESELNLINKQMGLFLLEANISFAIIHLMVYELLVRGKHLEVCLDELNKNIELNKKKIDSYNLSLEEIRSNNKKNGKVDNFLLDNAKKERDVLYKYIKNDQAEIKYWENYSEVNKQFIENIVQFIFKHSTTFSNSMIYNKIINNYYKELKNADILKLISETIKVVDSLTEGIKKLMDDYKLTVPRWGKVQQKVKYNSFIHINSNEHEDIKREEISRIIKHCLNVFDIEEFYTQSNFKTINLLRISNAKTGNGQIIGLRGQFTSERLIKLSCKLFSIFVEKKIEVNISVFPCLTDNGIEAYFNNQTKNFDLVKEDLFPLIAKNELTKDIVVFDKYNNYQFKEIDNYLSKNFKNLYYVKEEKSDLFSNKKYIIGLNMNTLIYNTTIGVITALPKEFAAMKLLLDNEDEFFFNPEGDPNDYAVGYIKNNKNLNIKVIIAITKETGTNNADSTATNLLRSFKEVNDIIVCGIAGGVPDISRPGHHVRLGDIVVSDKRGILQYDNISESEEKITIKNYPSKPSARLLGKVNLLIADYESNHKPWIKHINKAMI